MIIRLISCTLLVASLSACSFYKMEVQQGNYITAEELAMAQPGMSHLQIREVLGTPLMHDDFRQNRWDYVFYLKKGSQTPQRSGVTVFFNEQGIATDIRHDQVPGTETKEAAKPAG